MASVHGALTNAELTALMRASSPRWYLSVVNSSSQATAQINMPSGIVFPVVTLTVDTTSANWASVAVGNTVAIGSAAGLADYGLYRVRAVGDATHLHIGETSSGDPGLVTASIRNATFGDNAYITVYLTRRDIHSVIPRIIAATGEIFEDYSATVGTSHTKPDCIINITMTDTDRRAGFVDAGQTYRTIRFDAAEDLWPTSASITARLWTAPAAWGAPVAGSATGPSVTYRVPRSAENYEIKYQATDDLGTVTTAYRQIWAHDHTGATAPLTITEIGSIGWTTSGIQLSIVLNGITLASIPTGAMVCVWYDPGVCFNGTDIPSAISQFVGWVVRQREVSAQGLPSVELEIVGPEGMLARRGAYSQWFDKAASPATWQELPSTLEYVNFLTWWVAWRRARGVVECFNYIRDTHGNLTARLPQWRVEASGNLLDQMRKVAGSYSCNVGANPDGTLVMRRQVNMTDYSQRGSIASRCTLDQTRAHEVELDKELPPRARRTRGEGFWWDGATAQPTPMLSDAPGDAPGQGTADETLQGQTVDNQDFLNMLTGLYHAYVNNPYGEDTIKIEGFWPVFYPAEMTKIALSIPAAYRPDNAALSMNVMPRSVSLRPVADGAWDTILSVEGETSGLAGVTVIVPNQAAARPAYVPAARPLVTTVSGGHDGGTVLALEQANLGLTSGWFGGAPAWTKLTGTGLSGTLVQLALDPFCDYLSPAQSGALGGWIIATTGLYYCSNILTASPVWTKIFTLTTNGSGVIRPSTTTPGVVYIGYAVTTGNCTVKRLSSYGAVTDWSYTPTAGNNVNVGIDIDHWGSDEVLVAYRNTTSGFTGRVIARLVNGVETILRPNTDLNADAFFIQKPLKTFSGAANSSIGSSEAFIWSANPNEHIMKTADGGTTYPDVGPGGAFSYIPPTCSSVCYTDDSNVMAAIDGAGRLYTSTNGGTSWTSRGTDAGGQSMSSGFFPRLISGNYALYMCGTSKVMYSPDFGVTITDKTGTWVGDIGAITSFQSVIPLY